MIHPKELGPNNVYIDARAFEAMFLIARTACVALPMESNIEASVANQIRDFRRSTCNHLRFKPTAQPQEIALEKSESGAPGTDTQSDATGARSPAGAAATTPPATPTPESQRGKPFVMPPIPAHD